MQAFGEKFSRQRMSECEVSEAESARCMGGIRRSGGWDGG